MGLQLPYYQHLLPLRRAAAGQYVHRPRARSAFRNATLRRILAVSAYDALLGRRRALRLRFAPIFHRVLVLGQYRPARKALHPMGLLAVLPCQGYVRARNLLEPRHFREIPHGCGLDVQVGLRHRACRPERGRAAILPRGCCQLEKACSGHSRRRPIQAGVPL